MLCISYIKVFFPCQKLAAWLDIKQGILWSPAYFKLGKVFWADDLIAVELKRLKSDREGKKIKEEEERVTVDLKICERLSLRIPDDDFKGKQMMVILCDRYGNEKKLVFEKKDFS